MDANGSRPATPVKTFRWDWSSSTDGGTGLNMKPIESNLVMILHS